MSSRLDITEGNITATTSDRGEDEAADTKDLLLNAILSTPAHRLQDILVHALEQFGVLVPIVSEHLLVDDFDSSDESESEAFPSPARPAVREDTTAQRERKHNTTYKQSKSPRPAKRKRYELCVQCEAEYDVTANTATSCVFHPEELETPTPSDILAAEISTAKQNPRYRPHETYDPRADSLWPCCMADGFAGGCARGRHRYRDRGGDKDDNEDEDEREHEMWQRYGHDWRGD